MADLSVLVILHPHVQEAARNALMVHAVHTRQVCGEPPDCDRRALPLRRAVVVRFLRLLSVLLPRWPRVTVVTPTWQRRELLTGRCIPSVQVQQYCGEVEHVIVSDGPDPGLPPLDGLVMLAEHRSTGRRGLRARQYGAQVARGDVIAYLDDDNAWRERHLPTLVRALLDSGADFAYSRALCHRNGFMSYSIGLSPPAFTQIDTSLIVHHRGLLDVADWQESAGPSDWDLVRRWLAAGATWAFVPEITLDYYHQDSL